MESINGNNTAKTGILDQLAKLADNLTKILGLAAQLVAIPLAAFTAGRRWLREEELIWPRWLISTLVASLASIGLVLVICYLMRHRRNRWRLWQSGVVMGFGILALSVAGLVLYLKPPEPAWERLDVPELLTQRRTPQDFAVLIMLDQLSGRNGLFPGGKTYQQLLELKGPRAQLQEPWAGYFAPLIVPSTMPTTVSLRQRPNLNPGNASIGVVVLVWTQGDGGVKAKAPQEFGYTSLQASVGVPVKLHRSERASVFVFVYPWNAAASSSLPDRFAAAVVTQ